MIVKMVKCDECGTLHEDTTKKKFADRAWLAWGDKLHFCKECAKKVTIYSLVQRFALMNEAERKDDGS